MSVEVISLGCRMNLAESEQMRALLAGERDMVVINSCAVTAEAMRQTRQAIRRARRERPDARLMVTGCAVEIERETIGALGVDGLIANADKLDARAWNVPAAPTVAPFAQHTRAFVAVQNGCDHACTFCIIPTGRGPSRSRPIADVVAEVRAHVDHGIGEVVLTAVDLTGWSAGEQRLGDLVAAILRECSALPRLRLSSLDGVEIDPLLREIIASEARVMPHLHLSLQHGADLILKRMKRRHSRANALELISDLTARRPDIAVGADLIAGFPTESDAEHAENLSIIEALRIVHGHIFPYSPRAGTPAARMPQVPRPVISERAAALRAAVAHQRGLWLQDQIGRPQRVLAERDGTGHAENFARLALPEGTPAGQIVTIIPTRISEGLLA
ncbi:MAG: MiaB/RimO family radical SAM methylthiotransferase [Sphingomonadales bacterium]|nr:MiaB/RimO family radical SAM methylthiotransferase [Sphingomonadales bacterium]MDE2169089.1 MiaB/RimO family radical SAM methylthiotransferase [Sphingomonadales bacterium]